MTRPGGRGPSGVSRRDTGAHEHARHEQLTSWAARASWPSAKRRSLTRARVTLGHRDQRRERRRQDAPDRGVRGERAGPQARFLRGECLELGDGELPYGPLIGALRGAGALAGPRAASGSARTRARRWRRCCRALGEPAAQRRDDDSAQLRLFEALLELLELLGEERPVVLVIEDLHWADRSTRAFAAFLARNLRHERVLFVFSYRDDELDRRHPLRALLSELDRGGRTRRAGDRAVGPRGARRGARRHPRRRAARGAGGAPVQRAEGNPLYTEELLAAGLDGRGAAPQSLRDAFILRIERLCGRGAPGAARARAWRAAPTRS